ncbi:ferritin-like domain-containing protein [Streptomyces niger]|uniref:ferritin-like domain-containing protein n=1 Tax=Streptomyces niger TaxID=66373 RepID=UPI00069AD973|nr:ferritin-like protein [Streptomyces niger]
MTHLEHRSNTVAELMQVADVKCGEEWLREALQTALMLELATIPPYACAVWSIKDVESTPGVYKTVREILFDEMSHFGLVGNLLSAIGGTPVLTDPEQLPRYPGPLPGGVNRGLTVQLSGFDRAAAGMFAAIEKTDDPVVSARGEDYSSIGAFYAKVQRVLSANRHLVGDKGHQLQWPLQQVHGRGNDVKPLATWEAADEALTIIKEQGEGTSASPINPYPLDPGELAHYYAFLEISRGRKLENRSGRWEFSDRPVVIPPVYPMGRVPAGGWANDRGASRVPEAVVVLLDEFNAYFSEMLRTFEAAWRTPDATDRLNTLRGAVSAMTSMRALARALMQIPQPGDPEATYGPEFRYVSRQP